MTDTDRLAALFVDSPRNTILSWLLVAVLVGNLGGGVLIGRYEPVVFSTVAIVLAVVPAVKFRDLTVMPPWYFLGLVCLPVLWETFAPRALATSVAPNLALATLGLLLMVELHRFTALRLVPWFTVVLTVLFTLAMAGAVAVLRWSSDVLFGTSFLLDGRTQDAINAAVMIEFGYATVAGLLGGVIYYQYFRTVSGQSGFRLAASTASDATTPTKSAVLSDRLGVSLKRKMQLVAGMQVVLVGVFVYGIWTRQLPVLSNAAIALAITFIPPVLERDYEISIEIGLALWVTTAVFLHALGTAGLYDAIAPWDHLTHTLSATVVAATGYAALRAIDLHTDRISLPPWATFAFTLVTVMAMGVIWEMLEFVIDQGALVFGLDPILAQHGIDDTAMDMIFNMIGAILVSIWGTMYLVELSESLAAQLEKRIDR